jgi:NADH dehydrogenase
MLCLESGCACSGVFAAWVVWLSVHLVKLIGFCNRLLVLINWAWDYLFYERAVRLILPQRTVRGLKQPDHNAIRIQDHG